MLMSGKFLKLLTAAIKNIRKSKFVIPPETSESELSSGGNEMSFKDRLISKHRNERETSSEEDEIPPLELKKRIRNRERNYEYESSDDSSDDNIPLSQMKREIKNKMSQEEQNISDQETPMSIDAVKKVSNDQQIIDLFSDMTKCLKSVLVKE